MNKSFLLAGVISLFIATVLTSASMARTITVESEFSFLGTTEAIFGPRHTNEMDVTNSSGGTTFVFRLKDDPVTRTVTKDIVDSKAANILFVMWQKGAVILYYKLTDTDKRNLSGTADFTIKIPSNALSKNL